MTTPPNYGPPHDDAELDRIAAVLSHTFMFPLEHARPYMELAGNENVRVIRATGGEPAGALVLLPIGQWFGGRCVPMVGIAAVGIAPEHRGQGVGSRLMRSVVEELHASGVPLSALYPATQPVYRRVGYEQAGYHFENHLATDLIDVRERGLELRPVRDEDQPAVEACYRQWVRQSSGGLERNRFFWHRVREPKQGQAVGQAVWRHGAIEAYAFYTQQRPSQRNYNLHATDLIARTPAAGRRLLSFFADHRSMVEEVVWRGGPTDPLLLLLAEQSRGCKIKDYWMLRIVDVRQALAARGYPPCVSAELHFDVRDDVLPANNARFTLKVADGIGVVTPDGHGTLRIDVRGLSALYTGFLAPHELLTADDLDAPPDDLVTAATVFAGPPPVIRDPF